MSDNLKHGEEMRIERSFCFRGAVDISALTALSLEELQARREKSTAAETAIFEKLCEDAEAWETRAAETARLDLAIQYLEVPATEHTANKWQLDKYGNHQEISNMVYKMYYRIDESTKYDHTAQQSVPIAWKLTWRVVVNPPNNHQRIVLAGQDKKSFTDKAAMERYLQGRIKAYSHLFTEISPSIPRDLVNRFNVNGQLLPGYRVEGQEQERPSALDKLAAAKDAVAQNSAEKAPPGKVKEKSGDTEL